MRGRWKRKRRTVPGCISAGVSAPALVPGCISAGAPALGLCCIPAGEMAPVPGCIPAGETVPDDKFGQHSASPAAEAAPTELEDLLKENCPNNLGRMRGTAETTRSALLL